jgi:hypothetical protein
VRAQQRLARWRRRDVKWRRGLAAGMSLRSSTSATAFGRAVCWRLWPLPRAPESVSPLRGSRGAQRKSRRGPCASAGMTTLGAGGRRQKQIPPATAGRHRRSPAAGDRVRDDNECDCANQEIGAPRQDASLPTSRDRFRLALHSASAPRLRSGLRTTQRAGVRRGDRIAGTGLGSV